MSYAYNKDWKTKNKPGSRSYWTSYRVGLVEGNKAADKRSQANIQKSIRKADSIPRSAKS